MRFNINRRAQRLLLIHSVGTWWLCTCQPTITNIIGASSSTDLVGSAGAQCTFKYPRGAQTADMGCDFDTNTLMQG